MRSIRLSERSMVTTTVHEIVCDNSKGAVPDLPVEKYGTCIVDKALIEHHFDADKINNRIIRDINLSECAEDTKNVKAHQTDFLFYKKSAAIDWVRRNAFKMIEFHISLNHWKLLPVDGWGIKYNKGDYTQLHSHWPHTWAFVYFANGCPDCSPLEIYEQPDPTAPTDICKYHRATIIPQPGKMVIFPGWVQHSVNKHTCDHPRYTVAGNVAQVRINSIY